MEKNCDTCYWNAGICHEKELGKPIEETKKMYPNGCDCWRYRIIEWNNNLDKDEN